MALPSQSKANTNIFSKPQSWEMRSHHKCEEKEMEVHCQSCSSSAQMPTNASHPFFSGKYHILGFVIFVNILSFHRIRNRAGRAPCDLKVTTSLPSNCWARHGVGLLAQFKTEPPRCDCCPSSHLYGFDVLHHLLSTGSPQQDSVDPFVPEAPR